MKVSVLILTYNQEDTILQTLESVKSQITNFEYEIIIGDDASTDRTREICSNFALNKHNISLLDKTKNLGLIDNYKRLVTHIKGEYSAVCAGDDYWIDPFKLQKQVDFLEKNPNIGLVHTNFNILDVETNESTIALHDAPSMLTLQDLLEGNKIGALTVMIRYKLLASAIDNDLVNTKFGMEDYPVWLFVAEQNEIAYLNEITAVWRKSPESISNSRNKLKQQSFTDKTCDIQYLFAKRNKLIHIIKDQHIYFYKSVLYQASKENIGININSALLKLFRLNKFAFKYFVFYLIAQFRKKNA